MALGNTECRDFAPEHGSSENAPFWPALSRDTADSLPALVAAVHKALPSIDHLSKNRNVKPPGTVARRPQCTHLTMNRVHGDLLCQICGNVPSFGWLYVCQQDSPLDMNDVLPDVSSLMPAPDCGSFFETAAAVAENLQMSQSVISGIRAMEFNPDQIHRLLNQRRKVILTIQSARALASPHDPVPALQPVQPSKSEDSVIASVDLTSTAVSKDTHQIQSLMEPGKSSSRVPADTVRSLSNQSNSKDRNGCGFQACHACRPFCKDRVYSSFESTMSGQFLTTEEAEKLPILDAKVLSTIGLREPPTPELHKRSSIESADIAAQYIDQGENSATAAHNVFSDLENVESGHISTPRESKNPKYDRLVPTKLQHKKVETLDRKSLSSTSLPTLAVAAPDDGDFDIARTENKAKKTNSSCGEGIREHWNCGLSVHEKGSKSSLGSEVEVEGGVALTEEAVGTGVPDILTLQ